MGQTSSQVQQGSAMSTAASKCPIDHSKHAETSQSGSAQCPVQHSKPAECPAHINPDNQMPDLSQAPAPSQKILLPTERTISSIPRPSEEEGTSRYWDYPSPQQFYNALVRKGWETPEEHVETMVDIHNFLNEKAWDEVLKWEKRREGAPQEEVPRLARFMGKPGTISPKARMYLLAGWFFPERFNTEPPFDRHDWIIRRPSTNEEIRYVIDYYSAPPEPDGSPVFNLDVRPALDSWGSIKHRIAVATEDTWKSFAEQQKNQPSQKQTRQ